MKHSISLKNLPSFIVSIRARLVRGLGSIWAGRLLSTVCVLSGATAAGLFLALHFSGATEQLSLVRMAKLVITDDSVSIAIDDSVDENEDSDSTSLDEAGVSSADEEVDSSLNASTETRTPYMLAALGRIAGFDVRIPELDFSDMVTTSKAGGQSSPCADEACLEAQRAKILSDFDNRISDSFSIPENLHGRVGFWFDVYTKYDSLKKVIHHADYPWIIYKVVDTTSIVNSDQPRRKWMRFAKAEKHVKNEMQAIRSALRSLSKRSSIRKTDKLSPNELLVLEALKPLGGDLRKQAARALGEVRYQTGQKDHFTDGLRESSRYLGTMEKIFEKHKLPVELTRLPFVESSFNKHATSKVGASGIWQFMGNTGRKFMVVNDVIDERRSPFKATEAAARLLKENHLILHRSWPMAVTAWNHGPGGVRRASKAAGSRDLGEIVARYRSRTFDFASSNFYSEFLAALYAERYSDLAFGPLNREVPVDIHLVKIPRSMRVKDLAKAIGLSVDEFLLINPDLRLVSKRNLVVPAGFKLHVPTESRQTVDRLFAIKSKSAIADET